MSSDESSAVEKTAFPINFTIVGGGLSGLACAIALKRVGHNVVVLERDEQIALGGPSGGCRLTPNMVKVIEKWGLLEELHKRSSPILTTVHFYRCEGNKFLGKHVYTEEILAEVGGGHWLFVSYMDLRGLLYEKAQSLGAEIRTGCIVSSIDSEARTVTLASGESLTADVIIAADGPSGVGRTALIGRETESTPGGYVLYHTSLSADLIPEVPEIKGGPDADGNGVFVHYADGFCVYSYPVNPAGDLAIHIYGPDDGEDGDWNGQPVVNVHNLIGHLEPWVAKLASLVPPAVRVRNLWYECLEDWVDDRSERLLVVGDAAHPFPQGGLQTFGMLIEDAAVLGKLFSYLKSEDQIGHILWGFQDLRLERCKAVLTREKHRANLFTLPSGPEQETRDEAITRMNSSQWHGADLGLYSLEEPRVLFAYDSDEAGAEWWQSWGILSDKARREEVADEPVKVGVEVEVEAAVN